MEELRDAQSIMELPDISFKKAEYIETVCEEFSCLVLNAVTQYQDYSIVNYTVIRTQGRNFLRMFYCWLKMNLLTLVNVEEVNTLNMMN